MFAKKASFGKLAWTFSLGADSFEAVGPLLTRATELRAQFAAPPS